MQSFTFCASTRQITYLGTIREIDIVKSIADTKKIICNVMETNADEFQMLVVDGASSVHLDFVFMEEWITFEVLGVTRNKDVKIKVNLSATPNSPVGDY